MSRRTKVMGVVLALTLIFFAGTLPAQPARTTVQDVLYMANGKRFDGLAFIEWKSFTTASYTSIAEHYIRARITNGLLKVDLVPTTTASPGAYYLVRFVSDGKIQFTETWAVPPSTTPVKLTDIRIPAPPGSPAVGGATQIPISDVIGLSNELSVRPVKGTGYVGPRAAVINESGELAAVAGTAGDCVRVDGSSGPCGTAGGAGAATFVDAETPSGAVDGANAAFTLSQPPNPASSLLLYRNGILQKQGLDYTLSGSAVQYQPSSIPQTGDILLASYRAGVAVGSVAQVLCSNTGSATSSTSMASLGACPIPAGLLAPGDRVEVLFDYSHQGSTVGFAFEVRWGNTAIVSRSAGAGEGLVSGRGSAAVNSGGAQWSTQNWGNTLGLASSAGTSVDPVAPGITVSFLGAMGAATTETVTLNNFTVVRYPAP